MKKNNLVLGLVCFFSLHASANPTDENKVSRGNNRFSTEFFREAVPKTGNFFVSPYTVRTALAMTYAGSRGRTAKQMEEVLSLEGQNETALKDLSDLNHSIVTPLHPGLYELSVANALWAQEGFPIEKPFLAMTKKYEGAAFTPLDFRQTEKARGTINDWVRQQTKDRIRDLVPSGAISASTRLVLTNAIYFKAPWNFPFKEKNTTTATFFPSPQKKIDVPFLSQTETLNFADLAKTLVLELPYRSGALSMVFVLPKKSEDLLTIEKELTPEQINTWMNQIKQQRVVVLIPKFKIQTSLSAGDLLKKMGMTDAFSTAADFSAISSSASPGNPAFYLSAVLHKAFVEIDEQGTEAAAATAVVMLRGMVEMPTTPHLFKADHPFLFFIRHRLTGAILFIGRLTSPKE